LRLIFFVLVFANLVFYAWAQGHLGGNDAGLEPQRLARQLAPEKLRVVAAGEMAVKPVCRLVSGLLPDQAEGLRARLAGEGFTVKVDAPAADASYWVHIPPLANAAAAERKTAELRKLGITDYEVRLDEGPARFAISLGLFSTEQAAVDFLQGLGKRGVKSARIEVREKAPQPATLTVSGPGGPLEKSLSAALASLPGAKAGACP
jgi:hypothetical protein